MSKNLVVFVTPRERPFAYNDGIFNFVAFNVATGKEAHVQEVNDLLNFFDKPPQFVKTSVKGIVFNIYGFKKNGFIDHEYCEKLAAKVKKLSIPYRLMSNLHITAMCKFIAARINPAIDKEVLQIYYVGGITKVLSLSRTDEGYVINDVQEMEENYHPGNLVGERNPSKIIFSNAVSYFSSDVKAILKRYFRKWNPIVLEEYCAKFLFDAIKEIVDHMSGLESSKKYFVIPQCLGRFGITAVGVNPTQQDLLASIKPNVCLPATKECVVTRFHKKFYITSQPKQTYNIIQKPYEITKEGHRIKLTLSVDLNNYPTITYEPVIFPRIKNMPKKLNVEKTEKLPIIGFFDNSSVICLWNEKENCYKFLESWNGKFGKDLFMDFLLLKATLVSSSTEVISLPGAVYDLIKIMSMPANNIKIDPDWKFTFTKDDENPVLLEFQTAKEGKKAASPAFLMAMMLKEHIRAIRKEIGEKPSKLGFRLLDESVNLEAKKRIETGLKEACGMIKLECFFF